ncbi:MAG: response regulator [Treponema sp.]|jgi:signal transduction histidine kinase|nr:response regulator [Treponema sp.]
MDVESRNTLLVVDDENTNLMILTHILGTEYVIYTATDGESAIEKAKEYQPDLILLDIMMPDMDGYETCSRIKECDEIKKIPVIFITGLTSEEDEAKGLSLEAVDYITKPFRASIVKLRVRNQIQLVRLHKELEAAVNAAEAANRSKSAFLAKMSHEIRSPLNAILGISEIQLYKESIAQDTKEAFTKVFNSGDVLLGIINDILDISKIEAGKLELNPSQYDFQSMLSDTVFLNVVKFENKPVEFIIDVDENIPSELFGDDIRIKQILNNLLSNAFKYTTSGKVELTVSKETISQETISQDKISQETILQDNITLVFTVRDTGQGMSEEQIENLFDEYSRFNEDINRAIEGTGLGMNILQNLTRMMNGTISIKSEPGMGSAFKVRLPQGIVGAPVLGKEAVEKIRQFRSNYDSKIKRTKIVRNPFSSGRVLIVDDIDINLYVAREMMLPYGLQVDTAINGVEALEKIRQNEYDLVFMDHIMPIMDGVETTHKIRKMGGRYEKLPIVALTANAISGVKEMFFENGFSGFISKPLSIQELDDVLKEWMPQ